MVTPTHFVGFGSRRAVDVALHRLASSGKIRRLARGLYDYPRRHPVLGVLSPTPEAISKALSGSGKIRLQPSGAYAANLLGLSEQVPARIVFLTDGASRKVTVGNREILLRRTTPKNMTTAGRVSGLVIQALRHLGRENVDGRTIETLRRKLSERERRQLLRDVRYAPAWIAECMQAVGRLER